MKLSEKLAAAEQPMAPTNGRRRAAPKRAPRNRDWDAAKRKVRDLVLAEVTPRLSAIDHDSLAAEVRSALDRIVEREDVEVSPHQRRAFVNEVIQDTLGYGPL